MEARLALPGRLELFDMEADRTELHDLAVSQPARVKAMADMWDAWAQRCGVQPWPMPQKTPNERTGAMPTPPYLQQHDSEKVKPAQKPATF